MDDRSEDGTGAIVRAIAARRCARARDRRRAACPRDGSASSGRARRARAVARRVDARSSPTPTRCMRRELLPRAMHAMRARSLDFFTVAGFQELGSFWERVVQPQVFYMIAARYGGAGEVNRARRAARTRSRTGSISRSRASATTAWAATTRCAGRRRRTSRWRSAWRSSGCTGRSPSRRTSSRRACTRRWREIVNGWTKNIVTAGVDSLPGGVLPRLLLPLLLLFIPLTHLAPVAVLVAAAFAPIAAPVLHWAMACTALLAHGGRSSTRARSGNRHSGRSRCPSARRWWCSSCCARWCAGAAWSGRGGATRPDERPGARDSPHYGCSFFDIMTFVGFPFSFTIMMERVSAV